MDTEETHEDAPRDAVQYAFAVAMALSYFNTVRLLKRINQNIITDEIEDVFSVAFCTSANDSGYTEEDGYDSPMTVWNRMKKEAVL